MEASIVSENSVAGFPITSCGKVRKYKISYLFQYQDTELLTTINDIRPEDIEPESLLRFLQEKGIISKAAEWKFVEACESEDVAIGDIAMYDLQSIALFQREISA